MDDFTCFSNINIYSAHTNMDKAFGGTTDTFIRELGFDVNQSTEFLRICEKEISVDDLSKKIKKVSPNARLINNSNKINVSKIGFCAGSGMDLYKEAIALGCDCFVTGDIKYHNAVESSIVMFDVGHFDSEILIKKVFQGLYYLFSFIIEFFDYCVDIFSSLPSSLDAILISVVTISFVVIIYKAIHS